MAFQGFSLGEFRFFSSVGLLCIVTICFDQNILWYRGYYCQLIATLPVLHIQRKVGGLLLEDNGDSSGDSGNSSRFRDALGYSYFSLFTGKSGKVVFRDFEEEMMKSRMTPKRVLRKIVRVYSP